MRTLISLIICIVFTCNNSCGQTKISSDEKQIEKMLQEFYNNYFTVFATEPIGVSSQKKLEMLQQQYCTEAFYRKIQDIVEQTEADPFLKAQDSDIKYLRTLSIKKDMQSKDTYIASYVGNAALGETVTIAIHLTVVKVNGKYKIDNVW